MLLKMSTIIWTGHETQMKQKNKHIMARIMKKTAQQTNANNTEQKEQPKEENKK